MTTKVGREHHDPTTGSDHNRQAEADHHHPDQ
jgi:hypothetical protein